MGKPNFIYIGPNIPTLGLKQNTLYRGEDLPVRLKHLAVTKPAVRSLFVSTRDLAEVTKRINKKGTLEYTANQEMLAIARTAPR